MHNQKIPSENSDYIIPFLQQIKENYGNPLALVHDMGSGILRAIAAVFPGIRDYICHCHFLKAQGKNLFEHDYNTIRRHLRSYKLSAQLRKIAKALKQAMNDDEAIMMEFGAYLQEQDDEGTQQEELNPTIKAYLLITWILEASHYLTSRRAYLDGVRKEFILKFVYLFKPSFVVAIVLCQFYYLLILAKLSNGVLYGLNVRITVVIKSLLVLG